MKNIRIIEVPTELGAGTRGASLGIDAIKIAALDFMSNFFIHFPSESVPVENKLLFEPIQSPFAKRINGVLEICGRVSKVITATLKEDYFPMVISGEHTVSIGTIAGIKNAKPESRLGVIWMDAHADLHTPYTTPSGNVHGMSLAAAISEDNLECRVHDPDDKTKNFWEQLKNLENISPKILPQDIIIISLRDFEKEEKYLIDKYKIKVISTYEIRRHGAENIARYVQRYLNHCTDIYVSVDVDCLDGTISHGTGTPVSNGLKEREMEDLVSKFMLNRKICCFEITEINPTLDRENLMAEIAFNILQRSANVLLMNQ